MTEKTNKIYEFGDFRFETAEQLLSKDGEIVALTPKVFDLLLVLVENHGHLLSKDELVQTLWADSFVEEANLNVTISALRRALGEKPSENRYIETVPRRGYRFVAEVCEIPGESETGEIGEAEKTFSEAKTLSIDLPAKRCPKCRKIYYDETLNYCLSDGERLTDDVRSTNKSLSIPFRNRSRFLLLLGGIPVILIAGFIIWKFAFQSNKPDVSNIRTLAVLPFRPLTGNQSDGALEMGMTDALINKLSGLEQIAVRPTSSITKYIETNTDPLAAGRELQVEAVVDGKIQRADNKIRVTVQLLRVSDGVTLWAGSFDDFFTNIFAVQDSISEKMTTSLSLKINGKEKELLARRPTENTEAYALFLKARYYHEQISEKGSRKAVELYQAAIDKDPEYAMAYAWMVGALIHLANLNINRDENWQKARNAAAKAVAADPNLPDAHEALANIKDAVDWNWTEAEIEYKKAIELDPKNADAHFSYSIFLSRFKRFDEALREIETAKQLNPVALYMQTEAVKILMRAHRFDDAVTESKKILELQPDNQQTYFLLTRLYVHQSMFPEAAAALKRYLEFNPSNQRYAAAFVYRYAGQKAEAEKILRELIGNYKDGDNCFPYALYYILADDKDRAFEFLEKAYKRREIALITLNVDPEWDELHSDPRFQDLLRRIGLPQ